MKHVHHIGGVQFGVDGETSYSFVVIGQRDESAARGKLPDTSGKHYPGNGQSALTPQEYQLVARFTYDSTHGWYAMKPLGWATTQEEANQIKDRFSALGWINISIEPITQDHIFTYA